MFTAHDLYFKVIGLKVMQENVLILRNVYIYSHSMECNSIILYIVCGVLYKRHKCKDCHYYCMYYTDLNKSIFVNDPASNVYNNTYLKSQ